MHYHHGTPIFVSARRPNHPQGLAIPIPKNRICFRAGTETLLESNTPLPWPPPGRSGHSRIATKTCCLDHPNRASHRSSDPRSGSVGERSLDKAGTRRRSENGWMAFSRNVEPPRTPPPLRNLGPDRCGSLHAVNHDRSGRICPSGSTEEHTALPSASVLPRHTRSTGGNPPHAQV